MCVLLLLVRCTAVSSSSLHNVADVFRLEPRAFIVHCGELAGKQTDRRRDGRAGRQTTRMQIQTDSRRTGIRRCSPDTGIGIYCFGTQTDTERDHDAMHLICWTAWDHRNA